MFRIATYNIENLDFNGDDRNPSLQERAPFLRAMLNRLNADVICLQEVHGQELDDHSSKTPSRDLSALDYLLQGTDYANFYRAHTQTSKNVPYDERNLVVLSAFSITKTRQYNNDLIQSLQYRKATARPLEKSSRDITWERPILYVSIEHPNLGLIHVINLHLKSRLPSNVNGQKINNYKWKTAYGWAEGYFLSSVKRVGQALETRILVDRIFDKDPEAKIVVCGDFNAEPGEVPVETISGKGENTGNPLLRTRALISCNNAIPDSVRFSHIHRGKGNLLDHMLISQFMLPYWHHSKILNENLHDESAAFAFDEKYPESDHAPYFSAFATD